MLEKQSASILTCEASATVEPVGDTQNRWGIVSEYSPENTGQQKENALIVESVKEPLSKVLGLGVMRNLVRNGTFSFVR